MKRPCIASLSEVILSMDQEEAEDLANRNRIRAAVLYWLKYNGVEAAHVSVTLGSKVSNQRVINFTDCSIHTGFSEVGYFLYSRKRTCFVFGMVHDHELEYMKWYLT